MDLRYGSGYPTALLDVTTGKVMMYNSDETAAAVHDRFGGRDFDSARDGGDYCVEPGGTGYGAVDLSGARGTRGTGTPLRQ